VRCRLTA